MKYIEENKKEMEISGVLKWHKRGYTGKGIKIAEIEPARPDLYMFDGKLHDPLGYCANAQINCHGQKVLDVMHQIAPDAELYSLKSGIISSGGSVSGGFVEETLPYAIENSIHVIGASLSGLNNTTLNEKIQEAQEHGIIFTASAGNEGDKGLGGFAESGIWIAVGAIGYNDSKKEIYLKNYSSKGQQLDIVEFSGLYVYDGRPGYEGRTFQQEGTSFSQPMVPGMIALVQQFFLEQVGRTLFQDEIMAFIQDHVIDLGESGPDSEYGYGLFILPDPETIDVHKYVLYGGNRNMTTTDFIKLIKPGALEAYQKYSILPSITIAQAALESGWGKSAPGYNLFGIKWTSGYDYVEVWTKEEIAGELISVKAKFRKYNSYAESILDHTKLLSTARYAPVRAAANYKIAANALQDAGYATDSLYANKLIKLIEQYKLYEIDKEVSSLNDIDGEVIETTSAPIQINGTTFLQLRECFEAAGGHVNWTANNEPIEIVINGYRLYVKVGEKKIVRKKV